jgi:GNAT superfamily N-acetyltransferase
MDIEIVQLTHAHLEDASALFAQRYRGARAHDPCLAPDYEERAALQPRLRLMIENTPGVAALQDGRLVGFLAAYLMDDFRGERAVYSPEWANAATPDHSRRIYQALYTALAAQWVRQGYLTHYVTTLAYDSCTLEMFHWLGFGMMAVDALRDLIPVESGDAGVEVRDATPYDIPDIVGLNRALVQYMASAPIFLSQSQCDASDYREWLADPEHHLWLAYHDAEAVGYIMLQKWHPEACVVTQDERSVSIVGAFTKERFRGRGVGVVLLNRALSWARAQGFERCAVDFEPHNPLATAFWLRYFNPVCYSVVRHVNLR